MSKYSSILICDDDNIRTIKLNRPEQRNALNPTMTVELIDALAESAEASCGALILTGAGKCFSAGFEHEEVKHLRTSSLDEHQGEAEQFGRLLLAIYDFPKPTIAAVNGSAFGSGAGLAAVCDFTYCSSDAAFGFTEVKSGFVPAIASVFLIRQLGEKQVRDLLLTGRNFDAKEAHQIGLVARIITHPQILLREAFNLGLTLLKNSPEAIRWTKQLLNEHGREELDRQITSAVRFHARAKGHPDFREGIHAYVDKRPPEWPSQRAASSKLQPA